MLPDLDCRDSQHDFRLSREVEAMIEEKKAKGELFKSKLVVVSACGDNLHNVSYVFNEVSLTLSIEFGVALCADAKYIDKSKIPSLL